MTADVQAQLVTAAQVIREGGIVVYPTESFYAIGALATNDAALARIAALKGGRTHKPFALIACDVEQARSAVSLSSAAQTLAAAFWPGPLTIVAPGIGVSRFCTNDDNGCGVRVPEFAAARDLAAAVASPITATSANLGGAAPTVTIADTRQHLGDDVDFYLDGGRLAGGAPSTVVSFCGTDLQILREGRITRAQLGVDNG